jgi:hypothetical protein
MRSNAVVVVGVIAGVLLALWFSTVVAMGPPSGSIQQDDQRKQAQREQPTPSPQPQSHAVAEEKQQPTQKEAECSNEGQPSYYDCLIQLRTARAAEQQARSAEDQAFYAKVAAVIAGAALVFAAVAAAAALWTVYTMKDSAERQLRAYISIEDGAVVMNSPALGHVTAFIRFKNGGATPGYKVRAWQRFSRRPTQEDPFHEAHPFESEGVHGSGDIFSLSTTLAITPEQLQAVREGSVSFFVWGRVEYLDAFDDPHYFTFKTVMSGPPETVSVGGTRGQGWGLKPIANGFDAN